MTFVRGKKGTGNGKNRSRFSRDDTRRGYDKSKGKSNE